MTAARRVSFLRHSGWVSPTDLQDTLTIVGVGAVGSNAALLAAKMGFTKFALWDADIVEPHNLSNQAFDVEHLDQSKVDAMESVLKRFNPEIEVVKHDEFFTAKTAVFPGGPVVLAVDSMSARKEIIKLAKNNLDVTLVAEIRLGFDFGVVNLVDNMDEQSVNNFLATIRNDDEVEEGPCNQRMCTTLVYGTVQILVHQLCRYYVADRSGDDFVAPYRYFVALDNLTGATRIETLPERDELLPLVSAPTTSDEPIAAPAPTH
jgi:hypothetical protein